MEINKIKQLTELFCSAGLTELVVEENGLRIVMKKQERTACAPQDLCRDATATATEKEELSCMSGPSVSEPTAYEQKSPLAGIFYTSASPSEKPFIQEGDSVKKGDVLCIVEAMKLMNEICAERDGKIIRVCAKNEQIVEYGETLFVIG